MFSASRGLDSFDQYLQDVEKYPLIQDPQEDAGGVLPGQDDYRLVTSIGFEF